jgi:methionyl-tRNA synthetase
MSKKFYITTPIYYVNARPHIGHAYTTIACDTIARRQRLLGADTFFLTGTDEHGQKIERAAQAAGKTPQQYADEISAEFRHLWKRMGISNDDFIRTTEPRHSKRLQEFFRTIRDNGYIYKGIYTGQYCVSDELYVDGAKPGDPCPLAAESPRLFMRKITSSSCRRFKTSCWRFTRTRSLFAPRPAATK